MLQRLVSLILVFMLAVGLVGCSDPPYTNIDNHQLKALLAQGVPLYDIRRVDEWRQTGVVEGSRRLTYVDGGGRVDPNFMPAFSQQAARDQPVILICRTGNRTQALARDLVEKMGYSKVYNVRAGISRWIADGNPVTKAGL